MTKKYASQDEYLEVVSNLSPKEVDAISEALLRGFKILLTEHIKCLRTSLSNMKDLASNASSDASKKFEVYTMSCGDISDFHEGLSRRVGERFLRHLLRCI
jgi:hypothetical protein